MSSTASSAPSITTTWPKGFEPQNPPLHGFAVREAPAPADAVFAWIRRPDLHPEFYPSLHATWKIGGPAPVLDVGSKLGFLCGVAAVPMVKVAQCDPVTRSFAWVSVTPGLKVCHAFTVQPIDEHRSLIRSEEFWDGIVAKTLRLGVQGGLQKIQTDWTQAIVRAATAHPAGPPAA